MLPLMTKESSYLALLDWVATTLQNATEQIQNSTEQCRVEERHEENIRTWGLSTGNITIKEILDD